MARKYSKNPRNRNPKNDARLHKKWYSRNRNRLKKELGGKCIECGTNRNLWFSFVGTGPRPHISSIMGYGWEHIAKLIPFYVLLCKKHWWQKKIIAQGTRTHGTVSNYSSGKCRCDECRAAWNVYSKAWHKKRRLQKKAALQLITDGKFKVLR